MPAIPNLKMRSGHSIPVLGLGTWKLAGAACKKAVTLALDLGYTHIDTAEIYANQREIGKVIAGHPRKKLFLTSKVWRDRLDGKGVNASCRQTLKELQTDYLDLLLIHWPNPVVDVKETLDALAQLVETGAVRSMGVSNFTVSHLMEALAAEPLNAPITVNQVEFHPLLHQKKLLDFCLEKDIVLTAYSPLARGRVAGNPLLRSIGEKHGKTSCQTALRWLLHKNAVVIPKAGSAEHLRENLASLAFDLTADDIAQIDAINERVRCVNPDFAQFDD